KNNQAAPTSKRQAPSPNNFLVTRVRIGTQPCAPTVTVVPCWFAPPRSAGAGMESNVCLRAIRPYQNPDKSRTSAHPPVNRIKKGDGNMNQATIAATADNPPQR